MGDRKVVNSADVRRATIALGEIVGLVRAVQRMTSDVVCHLPADNSDDADVLVGAEGLLGQIGLIAEMGLTDLGESTFCGASAMNWLMPPNYREAAKAEEAHHG
jgi:hypothetical protein